MKSEILGKSADKRMPFRAIAIPVQKADGSILHSLVSGLPYETENGAFAGYRGIGTDQTSLVSSELERARLSEDLQHSQKLRAIGQLSGGISHDFNNLLAIIMGNLELIQLQGKLSKSSRSYAKLATEAAGRGAQLTRRLLAYSRQQPLSPTSINPGSLLVDLEDLLRRSIGEQIELEVVVGGGLWRCQADAQELETVILNLAINARDAMPEGGKLTLEAFNARLDREYAMSDSEVQPGQYVCFAFTDTGNGMDKATLDRVFEPYFTTKPVGEGSGLGLSMAFGFAKQSKGHIKMYSEPGKGTTVKLYMPRTMKDAIDEKTNAPSVYDLKRLEGLNVLVVEDQPDVRQTIRLQLEHFGCEIIEAEDPTQALTKCKQAKHIDVLLLDVVLPGTLKGKELSAALLRIWPDAEVIFMSGYTENSIVHNGQLDESVRLLQKPFSSIEISSLLVSVLNEKDQSER